MKNSLLSKRVERLQKAFGPAVVEESKGKRYKHSIDEWTDEEIKEYFFQSPKHLEAKAEETDWDWVRDNRPGGRLRKFLEGCTIEELRMLEQLSTEAEDAKKC